MNARQELIRDVDDFLTNRINNNIHSEMKQFLNLLGKVGTDEEPSPENQPELSIIQSVDSNVSQFTYLHNFSDQMLLFLKQLMNDRALIDKIYSFYCQQLVDIEKLISYVYELRPEALHEKFNVQTDVHQQLQKAQETNSKIQLILDDKIKEQLRKDEKCKEAVNQLRLLSAQVSKFSTQFNSTITSIEQKIKPTEFDGNSITPRKNNGLSSFDRHFNTTPNKQCHDYRTESPKRKKENVDKLYKQIYRKHY